MMWLKRNKQWLGQADKEWGSELNGENQIGLVRSFRTLATPSKVGYPSKAKPPGLKNTVLPQKMCETSLLLHCIKKEGSSAQSKLTFAATISHFSKPNICRVKAKSSVKRQYRTKALLFMEYGDCAIAYLHVNTGSPYLKWVQALQRS